MENSLVFKFLTDSGSLENLNIKNVKAGVTLAECTALSDYITTNNVIKPKNGTKFVSLKSIDLKNVTTTSLL